MNLFSELKMNSQVFTSPLPFPLHFPTTGESPPVQGTLPLLPFFFPQTATTTPTTTPSIITPPTTTAVDVEVDPANKAPKAFRYTEKHDAILTREVYSVRPYEKARAERAPAWEKVASNFNIQAKANVNSKSCSERMKKLLEKRQKIVKENEKKSGTDDEEYTELDMLLDDVQQMIDEKAGEDTELKRSKQVQKKKDELECIEIREQAMRGTFHWRCISDVSHLKKKRSI